MWGFGGAENQISLEDRVCISFVSCLNISFDFLPNLKHVLAASHLIFSDIFLCFPNLCTSRRLVGVMLNKLAFVAPSEIGFVHKSNFIYLHSK